MIGKKKQKDEHEEEKYQFMKETIKPQKKKQVLQFFQKVFLAIFLAAILGATAGITFLFVQNKLENSFGKKVDLLVSDTKEEDADEDKSWQEILANAAASNSEKMNLENYNKVKKRLAAIGMNYDTALVSVYTPTDYVENWYDFSENTSNSCGLIYKRDKEYYYIISYYEGILDSENIEIALYTEEKVKAELIAADSNIDMAVLRVRRKDISKETDKEIIPGELGSSMNTPTGTTVIAVGAPTGIMRSVLFGTVVKSGVEVAISDNKIDLFMTDMPFTWLASGVVLNTKGRVIGFISTDHTSVVGETGMSFVGISGIYDIITLLEKGENIAYLGMEGSDVDEKTAEEQNIDCGVYVTAVYARTPAYTGGMRVGDVITEIDGEKVANLNVLHAYLLNSDVGEEITVKVARKSNNKVTYKKLKIVLG